MFAHAVNVLLRGFRRLAYRFNLCLGLHRFNNQVAVPVWACYVVAHDAMNGCSANRAFVNRGVSSACRTLKGVHDGARYLIKAGRAWTFLGWEHTIFHSCSTSRAQILSS